MSNYRILVTGAAGFIGSHLAEALLNSGQHVTIIDDLSTGRFENIAHLTENPNFNFAIDTITNESVLDRLASECDVIYHLAAAVGVRLIVEIPVHTPRLYDSVVTVDPLTVNFMSNVCFSLFS